MYLADINRDTTRSSFNSNLGTMWDNPDAQELYQKQRDTLNQLLARQSRVPFAFTTYPEAAKGFDLNEIQKQAENIRNIFEVDGGDVTGFDLETLGNFGPNATESEKGLLAMTEVALVRQQVTKNASGMIQANKPISEVLTFGVEERQRRGFLELIARAEGDGWDTLSAAEQSTIKRLTVYSDPNAFVMNPRSKRFALGKLLDPDPTDLRRARSGLSNLAKVGRKQGLQTDVGRQQLISLRNAITETNNPGKALLSYNGTNYDIPFLNAVLQEQGIPAVKALNHYDARTGLSATNQGRMLSSLSGIASNQGIESFSAGSSPGSLGSWASAFGIDIDAHLAESDTKATMTLAQKSYQDVLEGVEAIRSNPNNRTVTPDNAGESVVFANKAVKIDKDGYDFMAIDGEIQPHLDYALNRNQFYQVDEMKFIPTAELDGSIASRVAKNQPGAEGLFALRFRGAGEGNQNVTGTIFRSNPDDIQALFQNDLSIHTVVEAEELTDFSQMPLKGLRSYATQVGLQGRSKYRRKAELRSALESNQAVNRIPLNPGEVTSAMVDQQVGRTISDSARRNFEGMFQLGNGRGFSYAETMYGTYSDVNIAFRETFGRPARMEDIAFLVKNGSVSELDKTLNADQVLGRLKSPQQKTTFKELYNVLKDTNITMETAINTIGTNAALTQVPSNLTPKIAGNYMETQKTLALRKAWGLLTKDPETGNSIAGNKRIADRTFADIHSIEVADVVGGNGYTRINASSNNSAGAGILNAVRGVGKHEKLPSRKKFLQVEALKSIADDLVGRQLLPAGFKHSVIGDATDPYHIAQAIGGELFQAVDSVKSRFSAEQMRDFDFGDVTSDTLYEQSVEGTLSDEDRKLWGYINSETQPMLEFDTSGFKHKGNSLDEFHASIGNTPDDIQKTVEQAINSTRPLVSIGVSEKGFAPVAEQLRAELNYDDHHLKQVESLFFNKKMGMVGAHDYAVQLFNGPDDNLMLAFTDQKHSHRLLEALTDEKGMDEIREFAGVVPMSKINMDGPVASVSKGRIEKSIIGSLNAYTDKDTGKLVTHYQDTLNESLTQYIYENKRIADMVSRGDFQAVNATVNRAFSKPILAAPGLSGVQTVVEGGQALKKVIPNMSDVASNHLVDMSSAINFLPAIYQRDEGVRKTLNEVFSPVVGGTDEKVASYMANWSQQLTDGGHNSLKKMKDMDIAVQEWYVKNLVYGEGLIQKVVDYGEEITDAQTVSEFKNLLDTGAHQILREDKVADGFVSTLDRVAMNSYGFMTGFTRPVQMQFQSFQSFDKDDLVGKEAKLDSLNIRVGESVVTREAAENYYGKMEAAGMGSYEGTVMANVRQMHTHEMLQALDATESRKEDVLAGLGGKYTSEDFDAVMQEFRLYSDTNLQHSLVNPILRKDLWNKNELNTFKIKDLETAKMTISPGDFVKTGDVIGTRELDGSTIDIVYNKASGQVGEIADDAMYVNPGKMVGEGDEARFVAEGQLRELKLGISGVEKTVASTVDLGDEYDDLVQAVWKESYGDAALVGKFELGKHLSGSVVAGSSVNYMAERFDELGVEGEFERLADEHLPSWNARYSRSETGDFLLDEAGKKTLLIEGNPSSDAGHLEGVRDMVRAIQDSPDEKVRQVAAEMRQMEQANSYRVPVRRMIMSEMHSAKGAEGDTGKGVSVTPKSNQMLGSNVGDAEFRIFTGERFEKVAQPILDRRMRIIQRSPEYAEGAKSLRGIMASLTHVMGEKSPGGVQDVNLEDLLIPKSGASVEEMMQTLFSVANENDGSFEGVDAFRVNLGGITIKNPETGERVGDVVIPLVRTHAVDGQVFFSDSQKKIASLLNSAKALEDGQSVRSGESIKQMQSRMDDAYKDMMGSFENELNHKDGIMNRFMLSGRMPFSGYAHGTVITSPVTEEMMKGESLAVAAEKAKADLENGIELSFANKESTKGLTLRGADGRIGYGDVLETSREQLEEMGVNFRDIGDQVVNERLANDNAFREQLIRKGILDGQGSLVLAGDPSREGIAGATKKELKKATRDWKNSPAYVAATDEAFEKAGLEYVRERGIFGTGKRDPVFKTSSDLAVSVRLNDKLKGRTLMFQGYTANSWNADVDGDMEAMILNLESSYDKEKGRNVVRLLNEQDPAELATRKLYEAQSFTNAGKDGHMAAAIDEYVGDSIKFGSSNPEDEAGDAILRHAAYIQGEQNLPTDTATGKLKDNYLHNEAVVTTAIKNKHNKGAIGYISTPNYVLREIGEEVFKDSKEDQVHLDNLLKMTDESEQKPIDVKHIKDGGEELTKVPKYRLGLTQLANGEHEMGLQNVIDAMEGPIFPKGTAPVAADILNGSVDMNIPMNQSLLSLSKMFQDPRATQIWNSPLIRSQPNPRGLMDRLKSVVNETAEGSSEVIRAKQEAIRRAKQPSAIRIDGVALDKSNYLMPNEGVYDPGIYQVKSYGQGERSRQPFVVLQETKTKKQQRVYGADMEVLGQKIQESFRIGTRSDVPAFREEIITKGAQQFVDEAMTDADTFQFRQVEALVASKTLSSQSPSDKIDVLESTVTKRGKRANRLRETVASSILSHEGYDHAIAKRAQESFFGTDEGKATSQFAGELRSRGHKDSGSLIRQFNDQIRERGASAESREQVRHSVMARDAASVKGVNSDTIPTPSSGDVGIQKIIQRTEGARGQLYNLHDVSEQLTTRYAEQVRGLDESAAERLNDQNVSKAVEEETVLTPWRQASTQNQGILKQLDEDFDTLASSQSDEAMQYLNWNSNDIIQSFLSERNIQGLGEARIAFGNQAGLKINEVSMNDLRGIYEAGSSGARNTQAARKTAEQIGHYFEALDGASIEEARQAMDRHTVQNTRGLEDEVMGGISDINDAIRKTGQSAGERKSVASAGMDAVEQIARKPMGKFGKTMIGVGVAVGLSSLLAGMQFSAPPSALKASHRPNGSGSSDSNGQFDQKPAVSPRIAPSSKERKAYVGNEGVQFHVKAKGSQDSSAVLSAVKRTVEKVNGPNLNVNLNTQDDTSQVSDSWLQEKLSGLF